MTTLTLTGLAMLFAWPLPAVLLRAPALRRVPRAAVTLWQSVALGAVLSALGAGLSLAAGSTLGPDSGTGERAIGVAALLLTLVVLGRLLLSAHRVGTRLRTLRRRHRGLIDLLARDDAGVRILEHPLPMAYCLPGAYRSRVVVSSAAEQALSPAELEAVLRHEWAHLRARHDLVLEAFTVLHEAFPRVATGQAVLDEIRLLIEVLADRVARRRTGPRPLVAALVTLAGSPTPGAGLAVASAGLVDRLELAADVSEHRALAAAVYAAAAAVLALPTAFVVAPWLISVPLG